MIGFWFLDVSSLLFVYMLFNFFCSGQMFPLDILPAPWNTIVQALPLQYMAYFPAAVFLEKITGAAMWQGLARANGVDRVFHRGLPRGVQPRRAAVQCVRRMRIDEDDVGSMSDLQRLIA